MNNMNNMNNMQEEEEEDAGRGGRFEKVTPNEEEGEEVKGQPLKSVEGWCIFVSGLHQDTPEEDLIVRFEEYGEAKSAIDEMNGQELLGMDDVLQVGWAFLQ